MGISADNVGVYSVDQDGNRRYIDCINFSIDGDYVHKFDPATGVLELSADIESIDKFVKSLGGFPIKEISLNLPFTSPMHFHNVREIKPLPKRDGTFFITLVHY